MDTYDWVCVCVVCIKEKQRVWEYVCKRVITLCWPHPPLVLEEPHHIISMSIVKGATKFESRKHERKPPRERERERLYYHLRGSNMTYETKNITFHVIRVKVSSDSRCSRTYINECCNRECTLWLWDQFVQGLDSIEEMWKVWPNMIKGRALY